MKTIVLISPYWKEKHRWMVSSFKLAELWQRLGYRVVAVCMGAESKVETVSDTLTVHYRKDLFLPDPYNYGIAFGFTGYVRKVIAQEKPEQIVVNKLLFWPSLSTIWLTLLGYKITVLTDALVGMTWWPRTALTRVLACCMAWTQGWLVLLCAQRIVFFHPQPETLLRRLGIAHKSQVIPTGIDPSGYGKLGNGEMGELGNGVVVTYVGRLESIKGVDDFLAALAPLKQKYSNCTIQVVGYYEEGNALVEQYQRNVVFTGLRDDIPDVLSKTDIFVMPSHSEGLSNAIMEAMSSHCACVATEVGGNGFLIQNGVSGLLYPPGDREALRAHVERLIEDPAKRKALGEAARKRIEAVFNWDTVGTQYKELFSHSA